MVLSLMLLLMLLTLLLMLLFMTLRLVWGLVRASGPCAFVPAVFVRPLAASLELLELLVQRAPLVEGRGGGRRGRVATDGRWGRVPSAIGPVVQPAAIAAATALPATLLTRERLLELLVERAPLVVRHGSRGVPPRCDDDECDEITEN